MDAKEQFCSLYNKFIKRQGCSELANYLERSDFFTAPASSKFHGAYQGGLCEHSVNVYNRLVALVKADFGEAYTSVFSDETLAVCALLHDVCKVNFYTIEMRNVKENGAWVQKPYYGVDERYPFGHGEKSVFIVQQFMKLTPEEAIAINWHMGGFDDRVRGGSYASSTAFEKYKLCVYLHTADLLATYVDEQRGTK